MLDHHRSKKMMQPILMRYPWRRMKNKLKKWIYLLLNFIIHCLRKRRKELLVKLLLCLGVSKTKERLMLIRASWTKGVIRLQPKELSQNFREYSNKECLRLIKDSDLVMAGRTNIKTNLMHRLLLTRALVIWMTLVFLVVAKRKFPSFWNLVFLRI